MKPNVSSICHLTCAAPPSPSDINTKPNTTYLDADYEECEQYDEGYLTPDKEGVYV